MKKKVLFILYYLKEKVRQEAPIIPRSFKERMKKKALSIIDYLKEKLRQEASIIPHPFKRKDEE